MSSSARLKLVLWLAAALSCGACVLSAAAAQVQEVAARVSILRGEASAQAADGSTRALTEGAALHVDDRITTASGAALQLVFTDKTRVTLGAQAELRIDGYRAAAPDETFLVSVTKGVFRVITGLIARSKPQSVKVSVPVATIGIRGTHFGGVTGALSAAVVLLEAEEVKQAAIEVSNAFGAVVIEEAGLGTEIPDAQSPPGPPRSMRLEAVDALIRSVSGLPAVAPTPAIPPPPIIQPPRPPVVPPKPPPSSFRR